MTTTEAIAAVEHLQQIKTREFNKYGSTALYSNLTELPFTEVVELLKEAAAGQVEDRITELKKSAQ